MSELHIMFKEMGITHAQMIVLRIIQNNENMHLKEIATILGTSSSAATQIVNGLVKKGYLVRKRNQLDRRILKLALTDKALAQIASIKSKSFSDLYALFDALSDTELIQYRELSAKITGDNFEETAIRKDKDLC
ncbi:MAG: MarR family transcriptional regulator [Actinobacteria bacterium]|nr:MarR family transcriptional regulator [Actinomycetota bacterium]